MASTICLYCFYLKYCPPMMMNMTDVEKRLIADEVEDFKIVSFSIDPAVDTPEILQEYLICLMSKIKATGKC